MRGVIEDGKLNLCLRNLVEYKEFEMSNRSNSKMGAQHTATMAKFEKGLGMVLRNAWKHVEVLQTTDIPLLLQHISVVLNDACASPERLEAYQKAGDLQDRQEV